jgi:hypothetical protein
MEDRVQHREATQLLGRCDARGVREERQNFFRPSDVRLHCGKTIDEDRKEANPKLRTRAPIRTKTGSTSIRVRWAVVIGLLGRTAGSAEYGSIRA